MNRIGVFICHCNLKFAGSANVKEVAEAVRTLPDVVHVSIHEDMCLDLGLVGIKEAIASENLDGVVITTCSSAIHGDGLKAAIINSDGLTQHQIEVVDLNEHLAWPCLDTVEATTDKVVDSIKLALEKLRSDEAVSEDAVPIIKRALVIGGGITGMYVALDIADAGYEVLLVEKTSSIGGHMLQYSEVFPTLDCPQCIGTPKMVEVGQHLNINIMAYCEVESVSGSVGNFTVKIRKKAKYVDWDKCNGCGLCQQKCLTLVPSEYNCNLPFNRRKAISTPFAQAVPNKPVIYREHCGHFTTGICQVCAKVCPLGAIDYSQEDVIVEEKVGAIVVASGFDLMPKKEVSEFIEDPDIIDGLEFERILCPSGPTAGVVMRPSDGQEPKEIVFISCVGSRDPEHGVAYCSRVCCMYLVKQALLYKHVVHDGQAYIFYMDIRTTGKGYEEFVQRAVDEYGVMYLRGRVSKIFREGDKIIVQGADTLSGKRVDIACDLVVLGMAMMPSMSAKDIAGKLGIATDEYGFFTEAHSKFRPMETSVPGIYVAGTAQGPRDIPDSVAMGNAAASMVLRLFSQSEIKTEKVKVA